MTTLWLKYLKCHSWILYEFWTCNDVKNSLSPFQARSLFAGAGAHGARFAAELLTELAAKQRTVEAELSMEETISAIRRAAKQGERFGFADGFF